MLVVVNVPVFILVGWVIFNSWSDFTECLNAAEREDADPDASWDQLKVFVFLLLCFAIFVAEVMYIKSITGS